MAHPAVVGERSLFDEAEEEEEEAFRRSEARAEGARSEAASLAEKRHAFFLASLQRGVSGAVGGALAAADAKLLPERRPPSRLTLPFSRLGAAG